MGWESQAVSLVPIKDLHKHVTHPNDAPIVKKIQEDHAREPEIRTVDFRDKKKSLDENMSFHPENIMSLEIQNKPVVFIPSYLRALMASL
jgi:hypothetical protein